MFRANRVGTPKFFGQGAINSTATFTIGETIQTAAGIGVNVINATPILDYGRTALFWSAAARTLQAGYRVAFGQQITVTAPIVGNAVGLELVGSFDCNITDVAIMPFFAQLENAATTLFEIEGTGHPTWLQPYPAISQGNRRITAWKDTVVIAKDDPATIAGTYVQGVLVTESNSTPTNETFTQLYIECAVRQFNDLQERAYRDPLR